MKIKRVDAPPKDILTFDLDVENELNLTPQQVEDVAEIFNTPLTGAYNWDYTVADNRIKKLYELGKELNWNGSMDLNWDYNHPADERIMQADEDLPHETLQAYESLTEKEKIEFLKLRPAIDFFIELEGEYGVKDLFVGVPVIVGKNGVERIVELKFDRDEKDNFNHSVKSVVELTKKCKKLLE